VPRGHCVIPEVSYGNRRTTTTDEFKRNLRDLAVVVYGPNKVPRHPRLFRRVLVWASRIRSHLHMGVAPLVLLAR
jgi:hypothetical protein